MNSIFIGGSRRISRLNNELRRRMDNIIENGYTVLVGDADGVDKAIQNYLFQKNYENVIVFCVADGCRNNIGGWSTKSIAPLNSKKDFYYYSTKDIEMAKHADYGFMIWDAKSKGTLHNIINLLKENKTILLYFSPEKRFHTLSSLLDLKKVLTRCDKKSLDMLEKKLNLSEMLSQSTFQEATNIADKGTSTYQHTLDDLLTNH